MLEKMQKLHDEWFNKQLPRYPYMVITGGQKEPRPENVAPNIYGNFIRVPQPFDNTAKWGFKTAMAAEQFMQTYKDFLPENMEPEDA